MTEYERGFIDGVKSKVTAELTPIITKMAGGLNQTIQEAVKTVIGNVKITAHEPDSDVQPVKHGRWENEYLDDDDVWWADCTNCKNDSHSRYGRVSIYAYCPNCGARMDGEQNEDN